MVKIDNEYSPFFIPLKKIAHPKGDIYHAMKCSDQGFVGFGEAYFTTIHYGEIKGWKKHLRMQLNLIVPVGEVVFYIYDELKPRTIKFTIGISNYGRLIVPPGYWVAFAGVSPGLNLVLNLASIVHDQADAITMPIEAYPLNLDK